MARNNYAGVLRILGRVKEASAQYTKAFETFRREYGEDSALVATVGLCTCIVH